MLRRPERRGVASAICTNTLDDTLDDALDRAPDAGGPDHWTGWLNAGATRASPAVGLSESTEHRRLTVAGAPGNGPGRWGVATA